MLINLSSSGTVGFPPHREKDYPFITGINRPRLRQESAMEREIFFQAGI